MRLLKAITANEFILSADLSDDIPRYAILSHTWGPDEEEVSFKDLQEGTCKDKKGYDKLKFCAKQAERDGITHFWVDTCCINKSDSVELNSAITSMFHWYERAVKCYAYLTDVPRGLADSTGNGGGSWLDDFRNCRWMTRGWTLQELLAPSDVKFFDKTGKQLGDKTSLERHICEITGIPAEALRGRSLSSFSIEERLSWQRKRTTKKPEDQAYSLAGICGVFSMIPVYGEGRDAAMARLRRKIDKISKGPERQNFALPFSLAGLQEAPRFIGREKELEEIHSALAGDGRRQSVVLHGLGGIGKTQTALAYARRHRNTYSAVFWFNIQDETLLKQSFAKAAKRILQYHPSADRLKGVDLKGDLSEAVEAVNAWLSEVDNTRWLAIYDNYDNPKVRGNEDVAALDIGRFLPDADQGSVIITTRSSQVRIGRCISTRKLSDVNESVEILASMSRRDLDATDRDVVALTRRLDGFPLALATAGAYLDQVSITVAEYLRLYETSWRQLHERDPGLNSYEDRTLYSTWRVSVDQIERQNELSRKLLELWCYFSNQDLWYELLRSMYWKAPDWLLLLTKDLHTFSEAMRVLCNYGLVEAEKHLADDIDSAGYSIHSCVHNWIIHVLNAEWKPDLAAYAIEAIANRVPDEGTSKQWITEQRLLPHADRCLRLANTGLVDDAGIYSPLRTLSGLYSRQGRLEPAAEMGKWALREVTKTLGANHVSTMDVLWSLGVVLAEQDKPAEAIEMHLRAQEGYKTVLGEDNVAALTMETNLGNVYASQGKLMEAEIAFQRVLGGDQEALDRDTKNTILSALNNLGLVYVEQGRLQRAEELYNRAWRGYVKRYGPGHVKTLVVVNNLGLLYVDQGRLGKAKDLYTRAQRGFENLVGVENLYTLETINNLGMLYLYQGDMELAEELLNQALEGRKKARGSEHSLTLDTMTNIGLLYTELGRLEDAETILAQAHEGFEKVHGADEFTIPMLKNINGLGTIYHLRGELELAGEMFERALKGNEEGLRTNHVLALETFDKLGLLYIDQGRVDEGKKMFERALERKDIALGRDHTSTLGTVSHLGRLYVDEGEMNKAETMYLRALEGFEKAFEMEGTLTLFTSTINAFGDLGDLYVKQDKFEQAEETYRRALEEYKSSPYATKNDWIRGFEEKCLAIGEAGRASDV